MANCANMPVLTSSMAMSTLCVGAAVCLLCLFTSGVNEAMYSFRFSIDFSFSSILVVKNVSLCLMVG